MTTRTTRVNVGDTGRLMMVPAVDHEIDHCRYNSTPKSQRRLTTNLRRTYRPTYYVYTPRPTDSCRWGRKERSGTEQKPNKCGVVDV